MSLFSGFEIFEALKGAAAKEGLSTAQFAAWLNSLRASVREWLTPAERTELLKFTRAWLEKVAARHAGQEVSCVCPICGAYEGFNNPIAKALIEEWLAAKENQPS